MSDLLVSIRQAKAEDPNVSMEDLVKARIFKIDAALASRNRSVQ